MTESMKFEMKEFLAMHNLSSSPEVVIDGKTSTPNDEAAVYDSFDHQYFETEIKNLIRLRDTVEQERFHSR